VTKPTEDWATEKAREWLREGPLCSADYTGLPSEVEASLAALLREVAREAYGQGITQDMIREERER
jgi:hypothetical protein